MKVQIHHKLCLSAAGFFMLLIGIIFNPFAPSASAALNRDIDLSKKATFKNVSMSDWQWNNTVMDPDLTGDPNLVIGSCGCLLSASATMLAFYENGYLANPGSPAWPHYPTDFKIGQVEYKELSWNPVYVLNYATFGSLARPMRYAWGLKTYGGCGVLLFPSTLEAAGDPTAYFPGGGPVGPHGIRSYWMMQGNGKPGDAGMEASGTNLIDLFLDAGKPVFVYKYVADSAGNPRPFAHTQIVVGWDNKEKKYLIVDPIDTQSTPKIPVGDKTGGKYEDWLKQILAVTPVQPAQTVTKKWAIEDDPSPVNFAVTDPDGIRSGYNPVTEKFDTPDLNTFAYRQYPESHPLVNSVADGSSAAGLQVYEAKEGMYRAEVIGIADGAIDYKFTRGEKIDRHVTGTITQDQKIKYEYRYQTGSAPSITEVTNFSPEAKAGGERTAVTGQQVFFDSRNSFDADGTISSRVWDFGDGTNATSSTATHIYTNPGTYTARLTVTDNQGVSGTTEIKVLISPQPQVNIERVDIAHDNTQARSPSGRLSMSRDAQIIAFESDTATVVPGDTNGASDVFIRDRQANTTERVSVHTNGGQMSGPSQLPRLSANGRFVLFVNSGNLWLHDRQAKTTSQMNLGPDGLPIADNGVRPGGVSDDGRYVAIQTIAALVAGDPTAKTKIYLRDREQSATTRISTGHDDGGAHTALLSSDGNTVGYLGTEPSNTSTFQAYAYKRDRGTTSMVSRSTTGVPAEGGARTPDLTPDGKFMAFTSSSGNLDGTVHPNGNAVYVKNLETGALNWENAGGAVKLSDDAQKMVIENGFLYDKSNGTKRRAAVTSLGQLANNLSVVEYAISGDGRFVGFASNASNLVPGDTNNATDIFVRDMDSHVPPVADISGPYVGWSDPAVPSANNPGGGEVIFNASKSVDPEGSSYTATWDFGDGSAPVTVNNSTAMSYRYKGTTDTQNDQVFTVKLKLSKFHESSQEVTTTVTMKPLFRNAGGVVTPNCANPGDDITIGGIAKAAGSQEWGFKNSWNLSDGPLPPIQVQIRPPLDWNLSFNDFNALIRTGTARPPDYKYSFNMKIPTTVTPRSIPLPYSGQGNFNTNFSGNNWFIQIACIKPANEAPYPELSGPYETEVGQAVTLDGSGSTDPENNPITYHWNFGDDTIVDIQNPKPEHVYEQPGTYYVLLTVMDASNPYHKSRPAKIAKVVVQENPEQPPVISSDNVMVGTNEGSPATNGGTFSDPNNTAVQLTASVGNVADAGEGRWSWTYTPADGPADNQTVTITATNAANLTASVSFNLAVANVPPTVKDVVISGNDSIACAAGNVRGLSFNVADPAGAADPINGSITWDDGNNTAYSGNTFSGTHSFAPGTYSVQVSALDGDDGITVTGEHLVRVLYRTGNLHEPVNADGTSNFKLGSTIPLKLDITDCANAFVPGLQPKVSLTRIGNGEGQVNEVVSSSEADSGNTMRELGSQYIFNLSTKRSQFTNNLDLAPGRYRLNITDPTIVPVSVEFDLL